MCGLVRSQSVHGFPVPGLQTTRRADWIGQRPLLRIKKLQTGRANQQEQAHLACSCSHWKLMMTLVQNHDMLIWLNIGHVDLCPTLSQQQLTDFGAEILLRVVLRGILIPQI
jgi:hypothetical protein